MATLSSTWKATAWIFMFWSPHLRHLPWYALDQANCMDLPCSKILSKKASSAVCPKHVMFTLNCTCPSMWIFMNLWWHSFIGWWHVRQSGVVVTVFVEAKHLESFELGTFYSVDGQPVTKGDSPEEWAKLRHLGPMYDVWWCLWYEGRLTMVSRLNRAVLHAFNSETDCVLSWSIFSSLQTATDFKAGGVGQPQSVHKPNWNDDRNMYT